MGLAVSHNRTVSSLLPLATVLPSGLKATEETSPVWPVTVAIPDAVAPGHQAARRLGPGRTLNEVADLLAGAVNALWTCETADRHLLQPEPIPVRWERSSKPIAGPVSAAAGSRQFPPLPGLAVVEQGQLGKGGLRDLHAVYGGLGPGRMVIVGPPGPGKTGAAVRLVLAALTHSAQVSEQDRPLVPVPVMFTMHGWDPNTQRVRDWLAAAPVSGA